MAQKTSIEWTDATWSPVLGCSPASRGCASCYAVRTSWRLAHNPNPARPVDLRRWLRPHLVDREDGTLHWNDERGIERRGGTWNTHPVGWVIAGGESGPGARRCDVAWIRSLVEQCRAAGVPAFVKQLGAHVEDRNDAGFDGDEADTWPADTRVEHDEADTGYQGAPVRVRLRDRKGGDPAEWPPDLRVREMPRTLTPEPTR